MAEPTSPISPQQPIQPSQPSGPVSSSDQKDAFLLQSPFAKMFQGTGATPTVQEIRAIINGILKQQISEIKREDAAWKEAMKKMKDVIEGND